MRNELDSYELNGRFDNLNSYDNIGTEKTEYQAQVLIAPIKPSDCTIM